MGAGDVVLTPLPQANAMIENRPAVPLCQMPPFGDWLVYLRFKRKYETQNGSQSRGYSAYFL
jgi:hypothetical protein